MNWNWRTIFILLISLLHYIEGCQFYPPGEYLRFVRVPENLKVGQEVLKIAVYPRNNLSIQPIDKDEDVHYFAIRDINQTTASLLLAKSLEDIVDRENPRNVLKFRIACDYNAGENTISSSMSVTVYVEDINDHAPVFHGTPYEFAVDELTPVGLIIYRKIIATDRDKPNTPNSDVQYAIIAGNDHGKFALESSHQAYIILKKPLDFDSGDKEFILTVTATDRGLPPRSTNTTVRITVNDNDDLSPKFTKGVYRTKINEFYPVSNERIHHRLDFVPPIYAFDQDLAIDAPIRYDIIAGNERHLFSLDHVNGSLFLERELDLDTERSLPGNTFVLQIQASQVDNSLRTGVARVEVEILDLNDNLPEFEVDFYNISIVENLPNGFSVLQIIATDQDQGDNGDFSYQLEDKSGAFTLDSRTGWLTVRDQNVLDREKRSSIIMEVYAKEKVPNIAAPAGISGIAVEVTLLDANDNNPTFVPNNLYNFVISPNIQLGDTVGKVIATDPDLGRNGLVYYYIQKSANDTVPFEVNYKTGEIIVTKSSLPFGRYLIFIEASDQPQNPSERRSALAVVSVEVKDQFGKENTGNGIPDFMGAPYEFWVGGNVGIGTSVGQIRVSDVPNTHNLMYDLLHSYHSGVPFAIEEKSGTITVVDLPEKFDRRNYDFEAVVSNEKDMSLVTNVTIHVVDPQDEKFVLMKTGTAPVEFHIKENKANALIGKLGFKNVTKSALKFTIANAKDVTDYISITSDGNLFTEKPLDRELRDSYSLTVIGEYNRGGVSGTGIYQVIIHVDDENDNKPTFERNEYEGKIKENSKSETEVDLNHLIHVSDKDMDKNGQFAVTIFGNGSELFRLDVETGRIYFISASEILDREKKMLYSLRLIAKDKGGLYSESKLLIHIEDENDNPPTFEEVKVNLEKDIGVVNFDRYGNRISYFQVVRNETPDLYTLVPNYLKNKYPKQKLAPLIKLNENVVVGTTVLKLVAKDKDEKENAIITYEIVSETFIPNVVSSDSPNFVHYFMIHSDTGDVIVGRTVPPEAEFRLNISASDKGGLKDFITVKIFIRDINDHPPIFKKSWYNFDVEEGGHSKITLGKVEATDADFGSNANVSYKIKSDEHVPFTIALYSGILSTDDLLDRETRDFYSFTVIAQDNPKHGKKLSSSVNVDVNVLDINDNPPKFYGYDDYQPYWKDSDNNYKQKSPKLVPIYYATAAENSPIGTPITKVFANDSDFTGNGNGLVLFDISYKNNEQHLFAIDSKEGIVTTVGKLDYESESSHNLTILASDLGSPRLSATAVLVVGIIDVPEDIKSVEKPVFAHRYYEVEVEENVPVPLKLLTLNVTEPYRSHKLRYSIVGGKDDIKQIFKIDPRNGTLFIVRSPDREKRAIYELVIRLDQYKVGRDMTVMVYPVTNERLGNLGLNEVKVIVRVTDLNDNYPKFTSIGRPIVTAIPTSANYGYNIIKLEAKDPDLGINGEVRYQILGRADDSVRRFAIDPITGQVRAIGTFTKDAGKVFGFDVKATDRLGADDGKSSIANIFVYVLDESKQLVMVMNLKPTEVEKNINNITSALFNATGLDVRLRRLEAHNEKNHVVNSATDLYLYAVDPGLNTVLDMNFLEKILKTKQKDIEKKLGGPKVLAIASGVHEPNHIKNNNRVLLSSLELGVVILGCVVFFGALVTAVCVICVRRKKQSLLQKTISHPLGYAFSIDPMGKSGMFPSSAMGEDLQYREAINHEIMNSENEYPFRHDSTCPRATMRKPGFKDSRERSRSSVALEKSITSLHSSGHDSGIAENAVRCHCEQTSSRGSSEESSNSYEDSLRSVHRKRPAAFPREENSTPGRNLEQRRSRNRSLDEEIVSHGGLNRIPSMTQISTLPSVFYMPGRPGAR